MKRGRRAQGNFLKRVFTLAIIITSGFFSGMMSCGGGGGGDSTVSAQSITTSLGEMNVGSVASIPFGSAGEARVTFSNLTGKEQFVLSFQSHTTTAGTYSTSISSSESLGSLHSSLISSSLTAIPEDASEDPMEATEVFHEMLRSEEANIPMSQSQNMKLSMGAGGGSLRGFISVGESLSVRVLNSLSSTSSYSTISCNIRVITSHFIACRDSNAAGVLSDDNLSTLMTTFENNANSQYSTYGSVSDVDGNGKVIVVFSPVLNGLGGSGGIVTGYFYAGDLYSGNTGEYIYCHVPDDSGSFGVAIPTTFYMTNTGPNCMPHELQHAINYNMYVFENSSSSEAGAYNEGKSHLAEHLFGNNNENPSRVNLYFGSSLASFTGGTSLSQRGGSYLFFRYLYEQAENGRFSGLNGTTLIRSILNRSQTGLDAVAAATGEDIDTILTDFFATLYVSNTGLSSDNKYNFSGINLRSSQDDNRGTVLDGPTTTSASSLPVSGSTLATSSNYTLITGSQIQANGNAIGLSASSSADPSAALIRIGDE